MHRLVTSCLAALLALLVAAPAVRAQDVPRPSDPTRTRTILAPTARTLGGGETRLGTTFYILPTVTHGVSDRIDLYGSGIFAFGGGGGGVIAFGAKGAVVDTPGLGVAVGSTFVVPFSSGDDFDGAFVALPYGVVTVGDNARSVSLGATGVIGGSYTSGAFDAGDGVLLSLGGETQVGRRVKLLADVLVPVGSGATGAVILPGIRFFGTNVSVDIYGFAAFADGEDLTGFAPVANFSYRF